MPIISTTIEIAAPPAKVREIFLDFAKYPEWSKTFFQSLSVIDQKQPGGISEGDILRVVLPSASFKPVVLNNTPEMFCWRGSIPLLFTGDHSFQFLPSTVTPGGTTFIHAEDFKGLMSFLVGPTWAMGKQTRASYEAFNEELKGRAEGSA